MISINKVKIFNKDQKIKKLIWNTTMDNSLAYYNKNNIKLITSKNKKMVNK